MECGLALEASRVADVDDAPVGVEQRTGGRTHLLALEPGCRREMRVRAQEIAELGETDAARARERACVGARCGLRSHALRERSEQRRVGILAAVVEIRPAALAGPKTRSLRLGFRLEQAHVLRLRLACAAGRQAVNARREHADDEPAVETARTRVGSLPTERLRQHARYRSARSQPRLSFLALDIPYSARRLITRIANSSARAVIAAAHQIIASLGTRPAPNGVS